MRIVYTGIEPGMLFGLLVSLDAFRPGAQEGGAGRSVAAKDRIKEGYGIRSGPFVSFMRSLRLLFFSTSAASAHSVESRPCAPHPFFCH